MRKVKALLCCTAILLTSCAINKEVISFNGPAFYQNDISYQPKPISTDSSHFATYVSATAIDGQGANLNDEVIAGQFNLGIAYTVRHFNLACGVFGAAGDFKNSTIPTDQPYYFDKKSFGVTGGRASANYYITSGRVDIRIIGLEIAYSNEFGDYAAYRKAVNNQPDFYVNTRTKLVTWGWSSEVLWRGKNQDMQFGFRLFIGATGGNNDYKNYGSGYSANTTAIPTSNALAYFMALRNYFMVAELANTGSHFTLGYRF
jgi:hypothetical protein